MRTKRSRSAGCQDTFDGYLHSLRSATEGSGDSKGLSEKRDAEDIAAYAAQARRSRLALLRWLLASIRLVIVSRAVALLGEGNKVSDEDAKALGKAL